MTRDDAQIQVAIDWLHWCAAAFSKKHQPVYALLEWVWKQDNGAPDAVPTVDQIEARTHMLITEIKNSLANASSDKLTFEASTGGIVVEIVQQHIQPHLSFAGEIQTIARLYFKSAFVNVFIKPC